MAQRITIKDIEPMVERIDAQLRELGELQEGDRLSLQEGSKIYGRSWRLHVIRNGETGLRNLPFLTTGWPGGGLLGDTAREAYQTLHTIADMLVYTTELRDKAAKKTQR